MIRILIALFIFGFLILIHELGHYTAARIFKVGIKEFSIGMGPKLIQKTSKKTGIAYSLRILPIGGFVSMDGEEEDSGSDSSLNSKPIYQRFIVMFAGAFMNILAGVILTVVLVSRADAFGTTKVASFPEGAVSVEQGLRADDEIVKIGNHRVHTLYELSYRLLHNATKPVDVTVIRNGEKTVLHGIKFPAETDSGITVGLRDFYVKNEAKSFVSVVKHSFWRSVTSCRMIWESLYDLVTGKYGMEAVSGPVGVTGAIGDAVSQGSDSFLSLTALIALNLGLCNLLPIPALDGGRILFLIIEAVRGKPMKREVEGYINFVGFALLMLLTAVVTYLDITRLIK